MAGLAIQAGRYTHGGRSGPWPGTMRGTYPAPTQRGPPMDPRPTEVVPAPPGWSALYQQDGGAVEYVPLVAWINRAPYVGHPVSGRLVAASLAEGLGTYNGLAWEESE